jgi:hypothetical protein
VLIWLRTRGSRVTVLAINAVISSPVTASTIKGKEGPCRASGFRQRERLLTGRWHEDAPTTEIMGGRCTRSGDFNKAITEYSASLTVVVFFTSPQPKNKNK